MMVVGCPQQVIAALRSSHTVPHGLSSQQVSVVVWCIGATSRNPVLTVRTYFEGKKNKIKAIFLSLCLAGKQGLEITFS